jgi:hypothetical protein
MRLKKNVIDATNDSKELIIKKCAKYEFIGRLIEFSGRRNPIHSVDIGEGNLSPKMLRNRSKNDQCLNYV